MNRARLSTLALSIPFALAAFAASGCAATSHDAAPTTLGVPSSTQSLDAVIDRPGPVTVETVVGADWAVPLSGLVNLDAPAAKAAKLTDRSEPIQVVFHALHHPTRGTFLVDTGVERAIFDAPSDAAVRGVVARFMHVEAMQRRTDTASWIARQPSGVAGVFLTHLHLDHVSGMRDVPDGTPVFVGPGEATHRAAENIVVERIADDALEGKPALSVWQFRADPDGGFDGVLDVFGDQTVFALHVPGHTPGSTAFAIRTPNGPVLLTGDACHTAWGWEHGVEPGTYSDDRPRSARSLENLRRFAARHPGMDVRVGHQSLERRNAQR